MNLHPVIICSNKVNRYGFRVLASGIELGMYEKNPILLYAHQRPNRDNPNITPVGKMHNIHLNESNELVGEMEFDQDDEFAIKLEKKWEKGMLNAVSLKAEMVEVSDDPQYLLPGQELPTLTKSLLEEISIEPVPGDSEAVALRLHYKGESPTVISLSDDNNPDLEKLFPSINKNQTDMKIIALAFKGQKHVTLASGASEEDIANAVTDLVAKVNTLEADKVSLSADLQAKTDLATQLQEKLKTVKLSAINEKAEALGNAAGPSGSKKLTAEEMPEYIELAKTNYDAVKNILDKRKGFSSVADHLNQKPEGNGGKYAELSFREIEKQGKAAELKASNPELFKEKYKAQYGVDYRE